MPGDVVGTAFVRIRALTDKLNKDIESQVKKAMKDADLEKAAQGAGTPVGEQLGDEIADGAEKTLSKRSKDFVPGDSILSDFDDVFKDIENRANNIDLDGFQAKFTKSLSGDGTSFGDRLRELRNDIGNRTELFDIDLPFFEEGKFERFFRNARASAGSFFTDLKDDFKSFGNDIDRGEISKGLDRLGNKFKQLGENSEAGLGFLGKSLLGVGGAIVAALPYIQEVGAAVLAYVVGLVAQVGFLGTAVAGAGVAAGAAIGAVATAALPIFLAFKSETKALTDFKDGAKASFEELLRVGTVTQATLLPALDRALFKLTELTPMLSEFGLFVGRAVGGFAELAANILTGGEAQGRFQKIFQSSLRILDILLPTLLNVGNILSGIWVAALPAAERFAGIIGKLVDHWSDMVTEGLKTGELTDKFDTWFDRAALLGSALGNVAGALVDIFEIGADSSSNVFVRFDQWAERFRNFTESEAGQNRLKLIFDNALAVMKEVNGLTADLFDGIFGRLGDVGGTDSIVAVLQKMRDVLPDLQEKWDNMRVSIKGAVDSLAVNAWEKLKRAYEELKEPLGRLVDQIFDLLSAMDKTNAFEVFLDLMAVFTDVLSTLLAIPGLPQFLSYFLAFNSAIRVGSIALGPFNKLFGTFLTTMARLIGLNAGKGFAEATTGIAGLINGFKAAKAAKVGADVLTGATETAATGAETLATSLGGAIFGLGGLALPLGIAAGALAIGGIAFFKHQQDVQRWRQEIKQATQDIGLLNDGLNVTAAGVTNYIKESSRFETKKQFDDLADLGVSVQDLGKQFATGTESLTDFIDKGLQATDTSHKLFLTLGSGDTAQTFKSVADLRKVISLTDEDLKKLTKSGVLYTAQGAVSLRGNTDLINSFNELDKVIGAAAKESVDDFIANTQNLRLLGPEILNQLKSDIDSVANDEDATPLMVEAQKRLAAAAVENSKGIRLVTDATRQQIKEQSTLADGTIDVVKQNDLLFNSEQKLANQIKDNLTLFASTDFSKNFKGAKDAVLDFSDQMVLAAAKANDINFDFANAGVDQITKKFPTLAKATQTLFDQLATLPEAQFNAAATALGTDADTLRTAMDGAAESIANLQQQALDSLPSVAELLDKATTTKDDGSQVFNQDKFIKGIKDRTQETKDFATNIEFIRTHVSESAARLAAQQGPEAAANLKKIAGSHPDQLNAALKAMEDAETALTNQIKTSLGPGIAAEYASAAGLISGDFNDALIQGLSKPSTLKAIEKSSLSVLGALEDTFSGKFVIEDNVLKFIPTPRATTTSGNHRLSLNSNPVPLSTGGFVDGVGASALFLGSGPTGTDTVPAWLTPGEFVLRRAIAQAIPPGILTSLNAGDPHIMGLLTSLSRNRPGSPAAQAAAGLAVAVGPTTTAPGILIQEMNIEAPTPVEAARHTVDRLRIMTSQNSG